MAILNFDARQVAPDQGSQDPVPAGWYNVAMVDSQLKPTSDGTGQRLAIVFQILDGQYAGRKLYEGLNLVNSNAQAQEIAYKQLSAIGHAVGHTLIGDSTELHNKPLKVKVKLKPAVGQYEAGNAISSYKNINDPTAVSAPAATNVFAGPPAAVPMQMPPGPAAWAPPTAPNQPWAQPQAQQPAQQFAQPQPQPQPQQFAQPAQMAAPVTQPTWAQAPAPAAPVAAATPHLQVPPTVAAPAPVAVAPQAQVAPPWATPSA